MKNKQHGESKKSKNGKEDSKEYKSYDSYLSMIFESMQSVNWRGFVLEFTLKSSLFVFELLLFFVGFFLPLPWLAGSLLFVVASIYAAALLTCVNLVGDPSKISPSSNFYFPAFLLIFYLMQPDPITKFAIIVFSAQGLLKTIYVDFIQKLCHG